MAHPKDNTESSEESQLLPCPFCGGKARFYDDTDDGLLFVECTSCFARSNWYPDEVSRSREDASEDWNQRMPCKSCLEIAALLERGIEILSIDPGAKAGSDLFEQALQMAKKASDNK